MTSPRTEWFDDPYADFWSIVREDDEDLLVRAGRDYVAALKKALAAPHAAPSAMTLGLREADNDALLVDTQAPAFALHDPAAPEGSGADGPPWGWRRASDTPDAGGVYLFGGYVTTGGLPRHFERGFIHLIRTVDGPEWTIQDPKWRHIPIEWWTEAGGPHPEHIGPREPEAPDGGVDEAVFGPVRHMDEIDAAREVGPWLDSVALALPRIANEQITLEEKDAGVKVYWRENKPHALVLTVRDGLNFTFGMGFDLSRLAALRRATSRDDGRVPADLRALSERASPLRVFSELDDRGRLFVIRGTAPHYTGNGEIIARNLSSENAKFFAAAVNYVGALIAAEDSDCLATEHGKG